MRIALFLALLSFGVPAGAQRARLDTLTPAQAISRAAAAAPKPVRAVFEFRVQNAAKSRDGYYLDSEKDFHSPANLGVVVRASAMPGLTQKYGADLKSALLGKTIKLIGQARRTQVGKNHSATATEVEVTHAGQILSAN